MCSHWLQSQCILRASQRVILSCHLILIILQFCIYLLFYRLIEQQIRLTCEWYATAEKTICYVVYSSVDRVWEIAMVKMHLRLWETRFVYNFIFDCQHVFRLFIVMLHYNIRLLSQSGCQTTAMYNAHQTRINAKKSITYLQEETHIASISSRMSH